jgi:hypothetical protein
MKIRRVGAEIFRAGGQTGTTKLTDAFRNFTNAPKKADDNHIRAVLQLWALRRSNSS